MIRIFSPKNGKLFHKIANASLGKVNVIITDEDSTMYNIDDLECLAEDKMELFGCGTFLKIKISDSLSDP